MWGQKAARIAELEARLAVALRDREPAVDTQDNALRSELAGARAAIRARDGRLTLLRQQVDQLIARLGEYADRGAANGQRADTAEAELARIRSGGLYRQIRAAANRAVGDDAYDSPARAVRDFARDLETWIPEDVGKQPAAEPGPRCVCGDPIQLMDDDDPASWIHSPGSDTRCLDARPATDPCAHGCRDAADEHTRLSQELDAGEVRP